MNLDISKLSYILFDWDNTLAQTRPALVNSINQVLREYQLPEWDEVKNRRDKSLSFRDNFTNIFGADKATEAYHRYTEHYRQNVKQLLQTFPGVHETLAYFKAKQIPMLIMTNKDRRLLEYELPQLFDKELFTKIVCGHEAPRDKPYPEQVYYALEGRLSPEEINRENVWVIGDSDQDSDSALASGALPIRVGQPIWNDDAPQNDKILYFNDFEEFYHVLSRQY